MRQVTYQDRVAEWMLACFSMEVCRDGIERNHRFLEEALELVQALSCTRSEAHQLVDYVFSRPVGEPDQELGGVQVTLAALCMPHDLNMEHAANRELARVWDNIEIIRAKQASKPKHSPLPETSPTEVCTQTYSTCEHRSDLIRAKEDLARANIALQERVTELLRFNNEFEDRARRAERKLKHTNERIAMLSTLIVDMIADSTPQQAA